VARCVYYLTVASNSPTASAQVPPNKNTANTSLVQALLGIGGIFLACPSDKVGGGSELHKRGRGVACSSRSNAYRNRHLKHKPSGLHEQ